MPVRRLLNLCRVLLLTAAACRGHAVCLELDPQRRPDQVLEACSDDYARTRDPRAAVAVTGALAARKDDAAVIAWAQRVGDAPGTARIWRRAYQAHQRRGERADMIAAAQRAVRLWDQAGAPGEAAYDEHTLKDAYFHESQLVMALEAARRERAFALSSDDKEMRRVSFVDLLAILNEVGDQRAVKALIRDMQDRGEPDPETTRALRLAEGIAHGRDGNLELSRLAYRDALALDEPQRADGDRAALYNLVEIEVGLGELDAASRDLTAAVATLPAEPAPYMRSARAYFTALVANARHDAARAEAVVRTALADDPIAEWAWQLEDLLGKALEDDGRIDDALAAYRRAIAVVEDLRRQLVTDTLQTALRERKRAPYEAAFKLEASRGQIAAAMAIAQLMWQRGFQDSFAADGAIASSADDVVAASAGAGAGAAPRRDPVAERVRNLTALMPQLARPGKPVPVPAPVPAIATRARVDGAASVLAFIEARGALWRYSRGDGPDRLERLALSAGEARRLVAKLRAHPDSRATATRLGDALIPAAVLAAADRPLAIIADGALAELPFAALRTGDRWLVQARVLAYWPALEAIGPATAAPSGAGSGAAVLAATAGRGSGIDLVAARAEAVGVGQRLGVEPDVGDRATIAALRGAASAPLLHLAAHGGLGPGGAFVRLADGEVTTTDVVTWHLAPRTVVLASCASGARPSGSVWGALGGAFLAAGSQAVVATLWSVEDAATAALIDAFYAAGGARDPVRALAAMQRQAIATGVPPRQWTAFVVLAAPQ